MILKISSSLDDSVSLWNMGNLFGYSRSRGWVLHRSVVTRCRLWVSLAAMLVSPTLQWGPHHWNFQRVVRHKVLREKSADKNYLLIDLVVSISAHGRGIGSSWTLRCLPTKLSCGFVILQYCDFDYCVSQNGNTKLLMLSYWFLSG